MLYLNGIKKPTELLALYCTPGNARARLGSPTLAPQDPAAGLPLLHFAVDHLSNTD